jgi:nucleoside-diphosphate-sugar epimerase
MTSDVTPIRAGSRILVIGATGFVASHISKQFLKREYKARASVRDLEAASWLGRPFQKICRQR